MSQVTSTSHCISDLQINTFIPLYCNQLPTLLQNTSPYFSNQLTDMTLYRYSISSQHFTFHTETASLNSLLMRAFTSLTLLRQSYAIMFCFVLKVLRLKILVQFALFTCFVDVLYFKKLHRHTISNLFHLNKRFMEYIFFQLAVNIYTLFDGFTDNTRGYFTSCVVFFRAPQDRGKMRATSNMSTSIICKTIE